MIDVRSIELIEFLTRYQQDVSPYLSTVGSDRQAEGSRHLGGR